MIELRLVELKLETRTAALLFYLCNLCNLWVNNTRDPRDPWRQFS